MAIEKAVYDEVAKLRAQAWKRLKQMNPNYKPSDVEQMVEWKQSILIMENAMNAQA